MKIVEGIPNSYTEATRCNEANLWQEAMDERMRAMGENKTWTLSPLPEGRTAVGGKWVFNKKQNSNGDPIYKARYVAKGFSQKADIDYHETFSPTAHMTSIRLLQQMSVDYDFPVHQMDVKSAYLNAPIDCEIYVCQPKGYEKYGENNEKLYCKLNKSLDGLKQSGRNWNNLLHSHLIDQGFTQSKCDSCLYTRHCEKDGLFLVLIVWVDDIIIGCNDDKMRESVKQSLHDKFKMKDLGEISLFLGIEFTRENGCVTMHQTKFIHKVLERFQMSDCKPRGTPCEQKLETDENESVDPRTYREIVGSLIYLMIEKL